MSKSRKSTVRLVLAGALVTAAAIVYGIQNTAIPASPIDDEPYRASPPLAITGFDVSDGTQTVFQTWFDPTPTVWRGELTAYPVDDTGNIGLNAAKWKASEKLAKQNLDSTKINGTTPATYGKSCDAGAWRDSRLIVSRDSTVDPTAATGNQIYFRTGTGGVTSAALLTSIHANSGTAGKIINWVRGNPTDEKQILDDPEDGTSSGSWPVKNPCSSSSGTLRGRVNTSTASAILGDIVNGKPLYVGAPASNYSFNGYPTFKKNLSKTGATPRPGRIYVGANDGMLHAFDSATGYEVWAYVPSMLIPKLAALTSTASPYVHNYYVDGGITVGDAFITTGGGGITKTWRTVIVGGLGAGGKGLYALDVTDVGAVTVDEATGTVTRTGGEASEDRVKAKILWEISPTTRTKPGGGSTQTYQDVGLGFTYPEPVIARVKDGSAEGRWVAIVGNGYNNNSTDPTYGYKATLLVIDLADGSLVSAIPVGSGTSNNVGGLAAPRVFDADQDGFADFVYAGDVDGNVWKFNISASTPATWSATNLYAPNPGGNDNYSVLGIPDVVIHPNGGFMVYFATGSLWTKNPSSNNKIASAQNYVIGVWDGAPATNTTYLEQSLVTAKYTIQPKDAGDYDATRVLVTDVSGGAKNVIDWGVGKNKGWKTALPAGMHVTTNGFVRDHRYHITAYAPEKDGKGAAGGPNSVATAAESWLVELDYLVGTTSGSLVFDMNGDGALTDNVDRATTDAGAPIDGVGGIPVGLYLGTGLFSQPMLALVSRDYGVTLFNENILPVYTPPIPPGCIANCGTQGSGIAGGHFDFDVYNDAVLGSIKHTHQYDDKYDVVGASFTNASDPTYNAGNYIPAGTKFFVLVSNGDLSPGVTFTVNGKKYSAFDYPNAAILASVAQDGEASPFVFTWDAQPPKCTAGTVGTAANSYQGCVKVFQWVMPVDGLTAKDWTQANPSNQSRPGLIPTQTGCVKGGTMSNPGFFDENNDGALTVWIVKLDTSLTAAQRTTMYNSPLVTNSTSSIVYNVLVGKAPTSVKDINGNTVAVKDTPMATTWRENKGYKVNPNNKTLHLAHYTIFWHSSTSGCYGDSGYNPAPAANAANAGGGTHPPGTEDPTGVIGGGTQKQLDTSQCGTGSCVVHQYSATYDGKKDKSETRITTTYYQDGSQLITKETINNKGKVTGTTIETRAGAPQNSPGQKGTNTVKSGSQVVTSQQELRNSGKLGRVSWHELINP